MIENRRSIPFDDLERLYRRTADAIDAALLRVARSGRYVLTQGEEVRRFESEFAAYVGTRFAVGVSSGTEALHLALLAMGIGPGDEVVTQANTYIATLFAISYTGARPVLVDVDPETFVMDPACLERALSPRTRCVLPVHLYGHPADVDAIRAVIGDRPVRILEDAAQSHGALYRGRRTGALGDAAAFSFYPTKNLGALGDAGAVVTDDPDLAHAVRRLRYMGQDVKYTHLSVGFQERMDEMQGAVLAARLPHLDRWNDERRAQAERYNRAFADLPLATPRERDGCRHVYYVYTVRVPDGRRDALRDHLEARGVATSVFYPTPLPRQAAYAGVFRPDDYPATERAVAEILHLPVFPGYTEEEIDHVADAVRAFYGR